MNRRLKLLVSMIATLALAGVIGCGDDTPSSSPSNNGNNGNNATNNGGNNATNNGNNGNNSNNGNNATNNGGNNATNNGTNNATNNGTNNANNGNNGGEPGTPADYDYSAQASFVDSILLETDPTIGDDVDGDGDNDNALGSLLGQLSGFLGDTDINATLAESIDSGSIALGATWPGYSDTSTNIDFFQLQYVTEGDRSEFKADPDSFLPGSKTPRIQFKNAAITGGALVAGPSTFELSFPLSDTITLDLLADSARLKGGLSSDASGVTMVDGSLSGAVPLTSVIGALNAYVASDTCACVTGGPLVDLSQGVGPQACNANIDASACPSGDTCGTIVGACAFVVPILAGQADIDLDGDGTKDAISLYIHLTATGTNISGAGN